jgi:hypothetical protein
MQDDQKTLLFIQPKPNTKTRMVGCRTAGMSFRGFIGHSKTGFMGDPSYRELVCNTLCKTPSEAMRTAYDLAHTLALRYGYSRE